MGWLIEVLAPLIEFMHSNTRNVSFSKPLTLLSSNILQSWAGGQASGPRHTR